MIKKILSLLVPALITFSTIIFFLQTEDNQEKIKIVENLKKQNEDVFNSWEKNTLAAFDESYYDSIKIKKDDIPLKYNQFNDSKKYILKIMVLARVQKDCEKMAQGILTDKQKNFILEINKKCKIETDLLKQKLYNLKGLETHPFDKRFLEKLDVYIYN